MEHKKEANVRSRIKSLSYAATGIVSLLKQEPNMRLHLAATIAVVIAGAAKGLRPSQWSLLAFAIGLVWMAEAFNTAIEIFCDLASDYQFHPVIKKIKDISAAAVLIASLTSIVIGITIFLN